MSDIGKSERVTKNRVIALFQDELDYCSLGDWSDRDGNSNIEEGLPTDYLKRSGYSKEQIAVALYNSERKRTTTAAACMETIRVSVAFYAMACR